MCRELHKDLLQREPYNLNPKPERFRALGIRDDVLAYGSEHSEVQRRGGECNYAGQDEEGRMFGSETLTIRRKASVQNRLRAPSAKPLA